MRREEEPVPSYVEYVSLRGSTFHKDCPKTLKKLRDMFCAKKDIKLRALPEPKNIRDSNAHIIQALVDSQWNRIANIPKEKVPKFTVAVRNNEIQDVKFKNIKCQYAMADTPCWLYVASVTVTKCGKSLPNDRKYRYNDVLH